MSSFINVRNFGVGTAKVRAGTYVPQTGTTVYSQTLVLIDPDRRDVAGRQLTFAISARAQRGTGRNLISIWNQANTTQRVEILDVDVGIYSSAAITGIPIPVAGHKVLTAANGSAKLGTWFSYTPTDSSLGSLHGNIRIRANPGGSFPNRNIPARQNLGIGTVYHYGVVNPEETAGWPMQKIYQAYPYLEAPITLRGSQGYVLRQGAVGAGGTWVINIRARQKPL